MWGSGPSMWNVFGTKPTHTTRFRTIDLSAVTGLTFFFAVDYHGTLLGIHAHTPSAPLAPPSEPPIFQAGREMGVRAHLRR